MHLDNKERKFEGSLDDLNSYANEHLTDIVNNSRVIETLSLIAAQITSAFGKYPVITPPHFLTSQE